MAFTYEPQPETALIAKGIYDAVVKRVTEKKSKAGNPMLELIVTIYAENGQPVDVFDYLLPSVPWKLRHFCESAGLDYEAGNLELDTLPETNVRVAVDIEEQERGDRNVIRDYIARAVLKDDEIQVKTKAKRGGNKDGELDDADIPF